MRDQNEMFEGDLYLKALAEINSDQFSDKVWLIKYFELYKQTLNWPKDLPPIKRSNLIKGTLKEKFNSTYLEILKELESGYLLENKTQTLVIY